MIIRTPLRERYLIISHVPLRDTSLSWAARGLLAYCLSLPDGWQVNTRHLIDQSPGGRDLVYRLLKELEHAGYLVRLGQRKRPDGTFYKPQILILEEPESAPPITENPSPDATRQNVTKDQVKPITENPTAVSTRTNVTKDQVKPITENPSPDTIYKELTIKELTNKKPEKFSGENLPGDRANTSTSSDVEKPKKSRARDLVFEALCEEWGCDWRSATKAELGRVNTAAKQLRDIGATPTEIHERAAKWRALNPRLTFTPTALTAVWSTLRPLDTNSASNETSLDCQNTASTEFLGLWELWPRHEGLNQATEAHSRLLASGTPAVQIMGAAEAYLGRQEVDGKLDYSLSLAKWLESGEWTKWVEPDREKPGGFILHYWWEWYRLGEWKDPLSGNCMCFPPSQDGMDEPANLSQPDE